MSEIILRKYHGVGNDYLIFDPKKNDVVLNERLIRQLCRRNIGVGADGILYGPVMEDKKLKYEFLIRMEVKLKKRQWHPDFSRYLKDAGYVKERQYYLTTKAGETLVTFLDDAGSCMRVDMGYAVFEAEQIPALGFEGEVVGESIFFCDNFYNATCVSMGNPNCVIMLERVDREKALRLGPYVENAKYFPNRINMQLCQIVDEKNIQVEIYERGAGYTFASGTGACAAAAASHRLGLVEDAVTVHMHGGDLFIEFEKDGRIFMTGPVVYIGKITVAEQFFA